MLFLNETYPQEMHVARIKTFFVSFDVLHVQIFKQQNNLGATKTLAGKEFN